jgi:hypothetical protein
LSLLALALTSGCVSNQKGVITPGADIASIKSFYVVRLPADERGINKLISDELIKRGYKATTGEAANVPADVDATVTYQDKWAWDITMYMLQLTVQFRNPKTEMPLATGECFFSSFIRRSPPEMVKETLDQIFNKVPSAGASPAMARQ